MKMRLVYFLIIAASMVGLLLAGILQPEVGSAQVEDGGEITTGTPEEVIPEQDRPGDTTVLFFAAVVLVLIAIGGVVWRNSIVSRTFTRTGSPGINEAIASSSPDPGAESNPVHPKSGEENNSKK